MWNSLLLLHVVVHVWTGEADQLLITACVLLAFRSPAIVIKEKLDPSVAIKVSSQGYPGC
jgi:hypothetical protein